MSAPRMRRSVGGDRDPQPEHAGHGVLAVDRPQRRGPVGFDQFREPEAIPLSHGLVLESASNPLEVRLRLVSCPSGQRVLQSASSQ